MISKSLLVLEISHILSHHIKWLTQPTCSTSVVPKPRSLHDLTRSSSKNSIAKLNKSGVSTPPCFPPLLYSTGDVDPTADNDITACMPVSSRIIAAHIWSVAPRACNDSNIKAWRMPLNCASAAGSMFQVPQLKESVRFCRALEILWAHLEVCSP